MKSISSSNDQQVNCLSIDHLNQAQQTKSNKSTKISFLNSALQSVKTINRTTKSECCNKSRTFCKKNCKSECKNLEQLISTSMYLEEHKGMDWRLQQLDYQLPECDERLLNENSHLSNELAFLRTQQKLCSIPVKLYINNNVNEISNQHNSSVGSNDQHQSSEHDNNETKICNRCEQVINKSIYHCVQADLSNLNLLSSKVKINSTNQDQNEKENKNNKNLDAVVQSNQLNTPVQHVYFHIDCLQCITCKEILVDFRAFIDPRTKVNDLKQQKNFKLSIYCSRHFLELFKPRCDLCEELIFDKKCTQAEGRAWHVQHFTCYQCKIPLGGQQYKMADLNQKEINKTMYDDKIKFEDQQKQVKKTKDIHPFCLACCDQLFGEFCARCEKLITCDQSPVKFEKYFWHAKSECFYCDTCGTTLVNSDYLPSSSAKQIFCSAKCAQSLQAKDLFNLNNGLMKLNDRLRNNQHKPTLNSVKEEDDYSCSTIEDRIDNNNKKISNPLNTKVEYENSSMFHLASSNDKLLLSDEKSLNAEHVVKNECIQNDSPSSNRSSNRSLSSLSLLFNSSPDCSPEINLPNSSSSASIKNQSKNSSSIESICSSTSNQLNSSTTTIIVKEIKSTNLAEQVYNNDNNEEFLCDEDKSEKCKKIIKDEKPDLDKQTNVEQQQSIDSDNQKLIPYVIVNNNPFTRTSIIIDNLNTTLSTMQILEENEFVTATTTNLVGKQPNDRSSNAESTKSEQQQENVSNQKINNCIDQQLSNRPTNNEASSSPTIEISTSTTNQATYSTSSKIELSKLENSKNKINSSSSDDPILKDNRITSLSNYRESIQNLFNITSQPTHYSTLPTRRTQRKPFKYEEPMTIEQQQVNNHYLTKSQFPITNASQSIKNSKPAVNSIDEVGLPIVNTNNNSRKINFNQQTQFNDINFLNFVNCTLPRSTRHQSSTNSPDYNGAYLNGFQSISISKLNATMLQHKYNRYKSSSNNLSINTSTNSEFSTSSSSNKPSSLSSNILLNSHSVVVSEDQINESLSNSKLIVKPLPLPNIKQLPTRTPPPLPIDQQQHGFIKKWSTTSPISNCTINESSPNSNNSSINTNHLIDLPVIKEHHIAVTNQTSSERTSTSSLGSSIEIQSTDTVEKEFNEHHNHSNLESMHNFSSSNNSLNTINLIQTNLNNSNSASLISATSSISSNDTSQLTRTTTGISNHHNRPDVILNPIETIKQLKQKQRELKLKEKMLKISEQSIDQEPKIIAEKLKTNSSTTKIIEEKQKEFLQHKKKNNSKIDNLKTTNTNTTFKKNNSVSNSLSSLTNHNYNHNHQMIRKQNQMKSTNNNNQILTTYQSQPNLNGSVQQQMNSSNGETCSNASTPDQLNRIEQLNQINHLNQLNNLKQQSTLNQSPSSQYSPTNSVSVNDTDCSSVVNSVDMENIVQFNKNSNHHHHHLSNDQRSSLHKKLQRPTLKDQFDGNKNCESQNNLKQKTVSFDPNVIENENNKAPKRLNRKAMNNHHHLDGNNRYSTSSSKKKYHHGHDSEDNFESSHSSRRKRNYQRDSHVHFKSGSSRRHHSNRRHNYEDDFCSTCSSSSCSSSSYCSSDDDEDELDNRHNYSCHGRKYHHQPQKQQQSNSHKEQRTKSAVNKLSKLTNQTVNSTNSIPAEQMVQIMKQQQLIIQQQFAQMQPKQQRYLKNNTNESCVIS